MQVIVKTGVSFGRVLKSVYFCDTQTKKTKDNYGIRNW